MNKIFRILDSYKICYIKTIKIIAEKKEEEEGR